MRIVLNCILVLILCVGAFAEEAKPAPMIELFNAAQPIPGLLTAGQPSEEEFGLIAAAGYRTAISLRVEGEVEWDDAALIETLGMHFERLSIDGAEAINEVNALALGKLLDEADGPVLLYCGSSNRVGALLALRAAANGASPEEALELGVKAGVTRLEPIVRMRLGIE